MLSNSPVRAQKSRNIAVLKYVVLYLSHHQRERILIQRSLNFDEEDDLIN